MQPPARPGRQTSASGPFDTAIGIQAFNSVAAHPASIEDPQLAPRFTAPARMTAAPSSFSLPLLPSGPDGVRRPELRRSRPSTPFAAARREDPDLSTGIRSG